jgi:hypothetical protein
MTYSRRRDKALHFTSTLNCARGGRNCVCLQSQNGDFLFALTADWHADRLCLAGLTGSRFFEKARCTSVLNLDGHDRQLEPTYMYDTCSHHRLTTTRWHSSIGFYSAASAIQSPSLRQTRLLKLAVGLPPSPPPHPPHKGPAPNSDKTMIPEAHPAPAFQRVACCTKSSQGSGYRLPDMQAQERKVLSSNRSRTWPLTAGCNTFQLQLHDSTLLIPKYARLGSMPFCR